ncbi:hypothetical protein CCUS01_08848 [Colletotrichum cuscutae]|uniref:Uncharacterized protein n=1 Tax=Colletotrichum cuscutae TaxID=1209917 RepID=A0AAI9UR27_9PEZI|nr:hypothetical protein CCUS01_08848 [Colletotrichum cuscutae]
MAAEREYRVVCRPKDCWITATSQYHWHRLWKFSKCSSPGQDQHIEIIYGGSRIIRDSIIEMLELKDPTDSLLKDQ